MAKVHLIIDGFFIITYCGLNAESNVLRTKNIKKATCKTCLKAYEAWKRRQRDG